jgi:hypothetical protein
MTTSYARLSSIGVKAKQDVETPPHVKSWIQRHLYGQDNVFDFDPCPINPTFDGLKVDWGMRNFVNPPYLKIQPWLLKARQEVNKRKNSEAVFLIPFRPGRKYLVDVLTTWQEVCNIVILRKPITFTGFKRPAPFVCALIVLKCKDNLLDFQMPRSQQYAIYQTGLSTTPTCIYDQVFKASGLNSLLYIETYSELERLPDDQAVFMTLTRQVNEALQFLKSRTERGGAIVFALIPFRPSSRSTMDMVTNRDNGPGTLAFICPHLCMPNTSAHSPFISMMCTWPRIPDVVIAQLPIDSFIVNPLIAPV